MSHSLFFIPDISGYTNFIQTTEIEHSQHVIAELLEVLIAANVENLKLAEIEGDALFFYKEHKVPSQERLLAQIERMFKAFYGHLKLLETNRICPCNACATAPALDLKIIVHCGELQFLEVQGNKKPFGKAVIESHRLLKNAVKHDNYVLISEALSKKLWLPNNYKSKLYQFTSGSDVYDDEKISYNYSVIETDLLGLKEQGQPKEYAFDRNPDLSLEHIMECGAVQLYEYISNYRYRYDWTYGVNEFQFKLNEVTRLGTEHACIINGKHIDFTAITKAAKPGELVYGEMTSTPPIVDTLYQFYTIRPISENQSKLTVEVFWEAKSPIKKMILFLFARRVFVKGTRKSLELLAEFVKKK